MMARVGAQGLGEALEWLYGTQLFGVKLGLDGMRRLAAALGVDATHVALATGDSSPLKTFEIDGLDDATILERLGRRAPAE